ncbi:cytochrome P450 [Kalaharituber pfeilii]|nr:cytochrome P450 [Kalaharituber pfeilii]
MAVLSVLVGFTPLQLAGIAISLWIVSYLIAYLKRDSNPSKLPVVGVPPGPLGRIRAIPASLWRLKEMVNTGYHQYHKQKNPTAFLAPYFFFDYICVIPPSLVGEVKSAPEHVLSQNEAFEDASGGLYSFGDSGLSLNLYHVVIVRQKLTATIGKILGVLQDEIVAAFTEEWDVSWGERAKKADFIADEKGDAGGWVDVDVLDDTRNIVARVSNRAFSGLEICRDKAFLENAVDYSVSIVFCGWGIQLVPKSLRWLFGPIIAYRNQRRVKFAQKKLAPLIAKRVAIREHNVMAKEEDQIDEPEDVLQFIIQRALEVGHHDKEITVRYLILNFAAIHTTSLTLSSFLLNMATCGSTDSSGHRCWDLLREEVLAVDRDSEEAPGVWTKQKLNKLVGMDSYLRETIRWNPLVGLLSLVRKVMPKEGYTFSNGLWLKQGDYVGAPAYNIHYDDELSGEDASAFGGFRFSKPYQQLRAEGKSIAEIAALGVGKFAAVTTGDNYLSFGHGKHACPGRFFAISEIKLILIHILLNYEVKEIDKWPNPIFLWHSELPPIGLKLKMRRRRTE